MSNLWATDPFPAVDLLCSFEFGFFWLSLFILGGEGVFFMRGESVAELGQFVT